MYCPRLEDKSLPEHVGFKIGIPHWAEPQHSNSQLDTNIHPSTNNGDDSLFKILMVISVFKNPGVKSVKSDPDPRAQRQVKPPIDRIGFINGNNCNGSLYGCRIVRGHSLVCFGISVYSLRREEIQKCSVSVVGQRTHSHTKSPDIPMETHLDYHSMYDCIRPVESLVATTITNYHNHGFI